VTLLCMLVSTPLIPEAGGVARVIGHQAGYVGVVALLSLASHLVPDKLLLGHQLYGTFTEQQRLSGNVRNHNWAGVAYDAGSVVGGLATGIAGGPRIATAIDPNATPGWSPQSWGAQAYDSSKGSFGDWMGTGPTHASGGVSTGAGGWLSTLFGAGCH
jgi:hypothetical protein